MLICLFTGTGQLRCISPFSPLISLSGPCHRAFTAKLEEKKKMKRLVAFILPLQLMISFHLKWSPAKKRVSYFCMKSFRWQPLASCCCNLYRSTVGSWIVPFHAQISIAAVTVFFYNIGKDFNSDMQALEASVCRLESSIVLSTDQPFKRHFLLHYWEGPNLRFQDPRPFQTTPLGRRSWHGW